MTAAEIRQRFLDYFAARGHEVLASSSLVPAADPTLLFTNAGMVQFKKVFLGQEAVPFKRAVTSQKCVRAGGKHNDLEEVGRTARHHTFFEMLGNFSFGDYFKKDAVRYAWEFLTEDLGLDPDRFAATVHDTDDEAADLWENEVGLAPERIYRLGDADNFWQMADTGPCGPCSELLYDVRPEAERGGFPDQETFVRETEEGRFLELWNLVFMQFDRDAEGELHALPAPSIDTGAGLERLAAALQNVDSSFHTDLFRPLLERVAQVIGTPYEPGGDAGLSYRVIADHARAVAFLISDGVFPSNEGRGYVLRRILRRAVRHAWLLGRRAPTLVDVVDTVIDEMGPAYPELLGRRADVLRTTRDEEERFLSTIAGGLERFDALAPASTTGTIPGEEAFRLYDTFGFPLDLTQLMAAERGWAVDEVGFERSLSAQRERSRAARASPRRVRDDEEQWEWVALSDAPQTFVGYEETDVTTRISAISVREGRVGLVLERNPFYVEAGGQVSDRGRVEGPRWGFDVDEVCRLGDGRTAVFGTPDGGAEVPPASVNVRAWVAAELRHDTERNHTATHLLHAALRATLGSHVVQRGSLVAPDRLRFDFAHSSPLADDELERIQHAVNRAVWDDHPVLVEQMAYDEAVAAGAMALFGEKYGERVRVVRIPGVSMELCGGTHVRHTGEIGLVKIVGESGVAAGVRRMEAQTGPGAFHYFEMLEERSQALADLLRARPENVIGRVEHLLAEQARLEALLEEVRSRGGTGEDVEVDVQVSVGAGPPFVYRAIRLKARNAEDARAWGDAFLRSVGSGVAVVAAEMPDERRALFAFSTDDLISRGVRADTLVREVAAIVGGRGGGRPHMAQAGVADASRVTEALTAGEGVARSLAEGSS